MHVNITNVGTRQVNCMAWLIKGIGTIAVSLIFYLQSHHYTISWVKCLHKSPSYEQVLKQKGYMLSYIFLMNRTIFRIM